MTNKVFGIELEVHKYISRHKSIVMRSYCADRLCDLCVLQVLTLPALQDVSVPTTAFMRLWHLEGRKLGRILRGPQVTLRYGHTAASRSFTPYEKPSRYLKLLLEFPLLGS